MNIATIVASNSHLDYLARVVDRLDVAEPPTSQDFGFGKFVICGEGQHVGVVYNSMLVNPDYGSFGPRLSGVDELRSFSPDFLDERGVLLGVAIVGAFASGALGQGTPSEVLTAGSSVIKMSDEQFVEFHTDQAGTLKMTYLPTLISQSGEFALSLVDSIAQQIREKLSLKESESKKLDTLTRSLRWQRTMDHLRL